jgi:hypothetical protein
MVAKFDKNIESPRRPAEPSNRALAGPPPVCGRAIFNPKAGGIGRLIAALNRKVELMTAMVANIHDVA